jgi:hypothetical protein
VAERLAELYRAHEVVEIVCDGFGPSASIAKRVDERGITVRRVNSGEYAQACGLFVDAVGERSLRHSARTSSRPRCAARGRGRLSTGGRGRGRSRAPTSGR